MVEPIQQVTQINLPNPRTVLIRVPLQNGGEALGYPTREFMALLRQFSVRVGGTGGDVDIINPDPDILAPLDSGAPQDAALSVEPVVVVGMAQLQDMLAQALAAEMQMVFPQAESGVAFGGEMTFASAAADSPMSTEMTLAAGYLPPQPVEAVAVTASPMTYTASVREALHVAGGTVTGLTYIRGAASLAVALAVAGQVIEMSPGDHVQITYAVAPTLNRIPR